MDEQGFQFTIQPLEASQVDILERVFSPESRSRFHFRRYEVQQRGEGVYLIAWLAQFPIGHFLLRWSGPADPRVMAYIDVQASAFLEAGETLVAYRRKGVATALIGEAERLAREKGCRRIGLEVASVDNPEARRLYERLGYVDWGHGAFLHSWEYINRDGNSATEAETVTYLSKSL